jgi:hypothetical protein
MVVPVLHALGMGTPFALSMAFLLHKSKLKPDPSDILLNVLSTNEK